MATMAIVLLAACAGGGQGDDAPVITAVGTPPDSAADADVGASPGTPETVATVATVQPHDDTSPVTPGDDTSGLAEVILSLAVPWEPEDGLSEEEIAAIAEAQEEVLRLLEGTRFRVIRLYQITPQIALGVDEDGLKRLERSPLVAVVSPNTLDPATG